MKEIPQMHGTLSSNEAVSLIGLRRSFGEFTAVDGVTLSVPRGTVFGLLGPNGAGKTTTIRMLLGIIEPDEGTRRVLGESDPSRVASRLGYLPEERGLYPGMKAVDIIAYMGAVRGMNHAEARRRGRDMLERQGLGHAAGKRIRELSKGMAQTVQIIGTLVHDPELVVLDEPFSGLDAMSQMRLEELIREIASAGSTVIFSTHVIAHAERLCSKIAIIAGGKVRFSGEVDDARRVIPPVITIETREATGPWENLLPKNSRKGVVSGGRYRWQFPAGDEEDGGIEPLLRALIDGGAGVLSVSTDKAGLHDAFVKIAGTQPKNGEEGLRK